MPLNETTGGESTGTRPEGEKLSVPLEQYCRIFTDNTLDAMFLHGADGHVIDVNRRACEHLGYDRDQLIGRVPTDFDPEFNPARLETVLSELRKQGHICFESVHRRADGQVLPVEVRIRSFQLESEDFAISSVHDISDRKREEQARRHQQMLLEESQLMAHLGSYEWDVQRNTLTWSDELYRIYGIEPGTPLTLDSFLQRVHPDDVAMVMSTIQSAMAGDTEFRMNERIVRPSGEIRHLESKGRIIRSSEGHPISIIGACLDVTDRILSAKALRNSEEHFRILFESSNCAIFELNASGQVLRINQAGCHLVGYTEQEIFGRNVQEVLHPDDREEARKKFEQLIVGYATQIRHSCRYVRKDLSIAFVDVHIAVARTDSDRVESLSVVAIDISAQKQLDEQIRETQKLEAVGRLAGGIAHDLNNLLTVVNGYPELMLLKMAEDDPNARALQAIRTAGERAARLSQQLLAFSRRAIVEPQVIRLNDIVRKSEPLLQQLIGESIELRFDLDEPAAFVKADSAQMEQVLTNLVINARDAMPQGGCIKVSTRTVVSPSTEDSDSDRRIWVQLIIADNGSGIPDEIRSRVFEPFFTTKPVGKGTGLGLAVVHGIVMQSDGRVDLESEVGRGTTVTLSFPRTVAPVIALPGVVSGARTGGQTILLVEDDDAVRQITRIALERSGYRVFECAGGMAAQELADLCLPSIHLLMTDLVMPEISGAELCQLLRRKRPDLPVIFISGFSADSDVESLVDERTTVFLQKPFTPAVLIQAIETLLHRTPLE